MDTVTIELDRKLVDLLHSFHARPEDTLTELLVLELYRRREISSGKAAELLGFGRAEFIRHASRMGIAFIDLDEQEIEDEIEMAGEI